MPAIRSEIKTVDADRPITNPRTMAAMVVRVEPTDPVTLAAVSGGLLLVALLACHLPARRALRINPAAVLRAD